MKATASAPGKLMLFGEHAVLYGEPCLVTAVNLRMNVTVDLDKSADTITIQTPMRDEAYITTVQSILDNEEQPKHIRFVCGVLKNMWLRIGFAFGGYIETASQFTDSYGLGSSSAVTVALIKALATALDEKMDNRAIFEMGYQTVLEVQGGRASGFDIASATYGGTLLYQNGGELLEEINIGELPLVVAYSGIKASTVNYVGEVEKLYKAQPDIIPPAIEEMGKLTLQAKKLLHEQRYAEIGRLMNRAQELLALIQVSTPELDGLIKLTTEHGAYGAKLSGAGGGDCIIALAPNMIMDELRTAVANSGFNGAEILDILTNTEGARVE